MSENSVNAAVSQSTTNVSKLLVLSKQLRKKCKKTATCVELVAVNHFYFYYIC